jgi:hypothetical protein
LEVPLDALVELEFFVLFVEFADVLPAVLRNRAVVAGLRVFEDLHFLDVVYCADMTVPWKSRGALAASSAI